MDQLSDLTFLKTFTANDAAKITKYVNMFLKASQPSLEQMKSQVASADWTGLKTSAHSMKTQLKYMGISSAVELALFIETSSGEGQNLDKIPDSLTKLDEIVKKASNELQEALNAL